MNCADWSHLLQADALDKLERQERRRWLAHLDACRSCRQRAAEVDPTLLFAALPTLAVGERDIEEMQRTVESLARLRALEQSGSKPHRWSRRVGALAALLLLALVLAPERPRTQPEERLPFAGALGVGSGLLDIAGPVSSDAGSLEASEVANLTPPAKHIYQLPEGDLVVVVIVDDRLALQP